MPKYLAWICVPIVAGLAYFGARNAVQLAQKAPQGLVGTERSFFVQPSIKTCLENPDPRVPAKGLPQYCNCFANGLADRISSIDLMNSVGATPEVALSEMQPRIDSASKSCLNALSQ